ncbi:Uncharacterised protein [Mycobacteroides abscessus subsp. abscessus]|nr:Uncharacterised protein [Mycobacteroides abscessus subsp. abscessus]
MSAARGSGRRACAEDRAKSATNVSAESRSMSLSPVPSNACSSWSYFAIVPGPNAER